MRRYEEAKQRSEDKQKRTIKKLRSEWLQPDSILYFIRWLVALSVELLSANYFHETPTVLFYMYVSVYK